MQIACYTIAIKKYVGRVNKPDHLANDHLLRKNLNNWMCSYNLRVMEIAILLQRRKLLVAIFFTIFTCGGAHDLELPFSHPHLKPVEFFTSFSVFPSDSDARFFRRYVSIIVIMYIGSKPKFSKSV